MIHFVGGETGLCRWESRAVYLWCRRRCSKGSLSASCVKMLRGRWLKPSEVLFILKNHEKIPITPQPPDKPPSGSLFLFNRRMLRFFCKDGHVWRRKKDGRTVGEAHERLKVENADALSCYYAHGEENSYFQRRSYWMPDPAYDHIVFVHYREVVEGHIRGHQARKKYKEFLWTVSVLEKAILRWHRGGAGLRGFKVEPEFIDEVEDNDDDILKIFRKQKVDAAIDEAVSRVLSMAESPGAMQQYRRMLEHYHLAKLQAEQKNASDAASSVQSDLWKQSHQC